MFTVRHKISGKLVAVYGVRGDDYNNTEFLTWSPEEGWHWADADAFRPWLGPEEAES